MRTLRTIGWMALLVLPLVGLGCQKEFTVAFTNTTAEPLQVSLDGPGTITPSPNSVPVAPNGGQAIFMVKANEDDLPTNYSWYAGPHKGSLIVTEDTDKDHYIVNILDGRVARMSEKDGTTRRDSGYDYYRDEK